MSRVILGFRDAEAVAHHVAREFVRRARAAVEDSGAFRVALAGGSTPRRAYELLADPDFSPQVDWESTHVFFGDERAVPPDHPDSNYRSAFLALLSRVGIPEAQVHRMQGERSDLERAAKDYEAAISEAFSLPPGPVLPRFDLVMLGMGDDGHTASLFPGTRALEETRDWVVANDVPQKATRRLTLTAPVLNAARCVMFAVEGGDKAEPLARVLEGPPDPRHFPSQLIAPMEGELLWLVDEAAAARLSARPQNPSEFRNPS
jgi:6-phosphogluconolactonase